MTGRNTNGGRAPSAPSPLKTGDTFNPYRLFNGPVIPYAVLGMSGISDGAKLLYGVLAMNMGGKGECAVFRRKLAVQLATSESSIGRWLNELAKAGLIQSRKQGPNAAAKYRYQWREELRTCLKKDVSAEVLERSKLSVQPPPRKRSKLTVQPCQNSQICTPERSDLSVLERSKLIGPYKEYENSDYENSLRDSSSFEESASVVAGASLEADRTDDDEPNLNSIEPEPEHQPEPVAGWKPTPEEIESARVALAKHRSGNPTEKPDSAITARVLSHFGSPSEFGAWIDDLGGRVFGASVRGWGFYGADAKNWPARSAEVMERFSAAEAKRKATEQAEADKRQRAAAEAAELQRIDQLCREKGWTLVFRSACLLCAGYGRRPESGENCTCAAGEELRRCHKCNNAGTITAWPSAEDRSHTPPLESWCTCEHAGRLRAERGEDYCELKNAEAWASLRHQAQSDRWDELYRANRAILRLIPGFKAIELGFACSDDQAERDELLERFSQGIARYSTAESNFRQRAA